MNIQKNKVNWFEKSRESTLGWAFTLVELIVVISVLAILGTIAFISLQWQNNKAKNSKLLYDIRTLNSTMEVALSRWAELNNLVLNNRMHINWVNTWTTILSWSYVLWDLEYEVWTFDYTKLRIVWSDYQYNDWWESKEYIFWYTRTPEKLYYEYAGQVKNSAWKYEVITSWNYSQYIWTDTRGLISEVWYDIWLQNWDVLTWSLYE